MENIRPTLRLAVSRLSAGAAGPAAKSLRIATVAAALYLRMKALNDSDSLASPAEAHPLHCIEAIHRAMEQLLRPSTSLFEVYLRLRPATEQVAERFLDVESSEYGQPCHITIRPPASDYRKRAVERFAFTHVFEEAATQLDILKGSGVLSLIEGVLGTEGKEGRDGLLATLGVTGSGKSHTILGSKTQRGLTQLSLDLLFRSIGAQLVAPTAISSVFASLVAADITEAHILPANLFLDSVHGDGLSEQCTSRAVTPMLVGQGKEPSSIYPSSFNHSHTSPAVIYPSLTSHTTDEACGGGAPHRSSTIVVTSMPGAFPSTGLPDTFPSTPRSLTSRTHTFTGSFARITRSTLAKLRSSPTKDTSYISMPPPPPPTLPPSKRLIPRVSALPTLPSIDDITLLPTDPNAEYAVLVSLYEVYNDRTFDLLAASPINRLKNPQKQRRALLFKAPASAPDRKVVSGLRKVACGSLEEALLVLETGLVERRVAGTSSNAVSSRSHGFFCVEVLKRKRAERGMVHGDGEWRGATLTIVDLAGSERARNANTTGATLAEAGKINESLMYLGQCMQMQSDNQDGNKPYLVPFRQCKLTELLFSNFFSSSSTSHHHNTASTHRTPQKAIMIVTADPVGDFNATSQILRYSALAREVTVPRIPSVTSTILSGTTATAKTSSLLLSGRNTPSTIPQEDFDYAVQEAQRLAEELEILHLRLNDETARRHAGEASWRKAEARIQEVEEEVREECWMEMERRIEEEGARWRDARAEEKEMCGEYTDRKVEILTRGIEEGFTIFEDDVQEVEMGGRERLTELEEENEVLRRKLEVLEREIKGASPTKGKGKAQRVLVAKKWSYDEDGFEEF